MAAFGMPVMHSKFSVRMVPYDNKERISDRLASPLIIKVIRSNNLFFPVLIRLNFEIGKVGKEIKNKNEWQKASPPDIKEVNLSKIDEFLNSLKSQAKEILI